MGNDIDTNIGKFAGTCCAFSLIYKHIRVQRKETINVPALGQMAPLNISRRGLNHILLLPELPLSRLSGLMRTLMVTVVRFHLTDLILYLFHDGLQPMVLGLQVQNDNQHTTLRDNGNTDV
ncbi:uncharacterized protein G2W53_041413 [Senna tora]|uniref:Uncharacterized protein n=1 Tax=Senna tora TaxID=362788 RepID=A0A834SFI0_9FABA|nr:uncharacterized protein G2W53_041413 [Senna tora]